MTVDQGDFRAALDAWVTAARREGVAANFDSAREIRDTARSLLTALSHAPETRTPSPEGAPPAAISGRLAASVEAQRDGDDALVGPTAEASSENGPYGRFLEMGGDHIAHNDTGEMWWREDGRWHRAAALEKLPRPYLKPAVNRTVESGDVSRIYYDHWRAAQEEVTA